MKNINKPNKYLLNKNSKINGFSFIEFIFVITLLGITGSIIVPIFNSSQNKARQKEATLIVNSMLKAAKSNYGLYAYLPTSFREIIKFTGLKKCNANDVDINGRLSCKNVRPTPVEKNDISFFSPSGNYKIEMSSTYSREDGSMFLVKANPNGLNYKDEGSAVVGCYSPTSGVSLVKEFSGNDKGEKDYITCGSRENRGIGNGQMERERKGWTRWMETWERVE